MFSERYLRDFAIGLQMLNAPFGSIPQISHHGGKLLLVRQRRDTSIALTGMENSLLIAEALLPQLEGAAASILRNLQSGSLPETPVERLTFAGYVALSHTRTPRAKRVADDWAIQQNVESLRLIVNTPGKLEEFLRMMRSEEHTSELQSLRHLVCRLLLEKKKYNTEL